MRKDTKLEIKIAFISLTLMSTVVCTIDEWRRQRRMNKENDIFEEVNVKDMERQIAGLITKEKKIKVSEFMKQYMEL